MSYSFSARGATKAEAATAAGVEFDKVVAGQPIHAKDRAQALAAVQGMLDVIDENVGRDVVLYVSGSVSWNGAYDKPDEATITSANVSVSASQIDKDIT